MAARLSCRGSRDMAACRGSRDMAVCRGSRDMAVCRESRDMAACRGSRDMAACRGSRDMAVCRESRDMAVCTGQPEMYLVLNGVLQCLVVGHQPLLVSKLEREEEGDNVYRLLSSHAVPCGPYLVGQVELKSVL